MGKGWNEGIDTEGSLKSVSKRETPGAMALKGREEDGVYKEERGTRRESTVHVKGTRQDEDREVTVTWKGRTACSLLFC